MSLLYIVDGYNVIHRSGLFRDKKLRAAREAFLNFLEAHRPFGSAKNRVIIVFDGSTEVYGFPSNSAFEVRFSSGRNADEEIKELVAKADNPKNIVVVTDDKALARGVRSCGAKIMATEELLNKKAVMRKGSDAELNIVQREAITEELRRIWLNKRSS